MNEITIPLKFLTAMNSLASDETRPEINSVLVEQTETATLLVATDGRRLGVLRIAGGAFAPNKIIVPRSIIARLERIGEGGDVVVSSTDKDGSIRYGFGSGAEVEFWWPREHKFPGWRQALPSVASVASEAWKELSICAEYYDGWHILAAKLGGSGYFTLRQASPMTPIEVVLVGVENFYGVLMPAHGFRLPDMSWVKNL